MLGSLVLYLKGMRRMMFQVSGFYYRVKGSGHLLGLRIWFLVSGGGLGIPGIPGFRFRVWVSEEGTTSWSNVGAKILRVGFGGIIYDNKEPSKPHPVSFEEHRSSPFLWRNSDFLRFSDQVNRLSV